MKRPWIVVSDDRRGDWEYVMYRYKAEKEAREVYDRLRSKDKDFFVLLAKVIKTTLLED